MGKGRRYAPGVLAPGPRRLGLRRRVVLGFTAGALLLSALSAVATWLLSAQYLVNQRVRIATEEAANTAVALQQGLGSQDDVPAVLDRVTSPRVEALVRRDGEWFSSTLGLTPSDVPDAVLQALEDGRSTRQRVELRGAPKLFVGFPLPAQAAVHVAVVPLDELDETLRALSLSLVVAAALTTLAGAALGLWASRRALRPVEEVSRAAAAVATGDLDARLETDDPDLHQIATTFNATVAALRERVERDVRFAADVSHELRSPLTTLANAVSVLAARRSEMSATSAAMLDALEAEVERFSRIVRDLLAISLDGARPHLEQVSVPGLARAVAGERVPVHVEADAADGVVWGDLRRLERVLSNLLDNADRHGGGAVGVLVRRAGDDVQVVVDDAGPGVPAELRREVFERFHRGAHARSGADGAGLGLALVASHVRLHGGRVSVEERPGGGARFVVHLPAGVP